MSVKICYQHTTRTLGNAILYATWQIKNVHADFLDGAKVSLKVSVAGVDKRQIIITRATWLGPTDFV